MANGTISIVGNLYSGSRIEVAITLDTAGDKIADVTIPSPPSGYIYLGCVFSTTTYRCYVHGLGNNRIYYTVSTPLSDGQAVIFVTPLYIKTK